MGMPPNLRVRGEVQGDSTSGSEVRDWGFGGSGGRRQRVCAWMRQGELVCAQGCTLLGARAAWRWGSGRRGGTSARGLGRH